jgi:hypothetical protein
MKHFAKLNSEIGVYQQIRGFSPCKMVSEFG